MVCHAPDRRRLLAQPDDLAGVVAAALELPTGDRRRFLENSCPGDGVLRDLAIDLVESTGDLGNARSPEAVAAAAHEVVGRAGSTPIAGRLQIPGFELLEVLGEGGMGVVHRALQQKPRRHVALKVLRTATPSVESIRRFERETQLLALLQHPGIVQVLAAGTAETPMGPLPWLALELVDGQGLREYVAERRLSAAARCELVARIADAVHFAHERGVVHRDLKPANVVVMEVEPGGMLPKVLDFGVARAVGVELDLPSFATRTGQLVGTLPYMSPEQLAAEPDRIDRRTDVYALGVMLYELLCGRLPLDVGQRPFGEAARMIQDQVPRRLGHVDAALRGDLEVVAATALAKEPELRYQTAASLAADLRRVVSGEPIAARPQTTWHQLTRFARRNRAIVGVILAAFLLVTMALVALAVVAARESSQRQQTELARRELGRSLYRAEMNLGGLALGSLRGIDEARRVTERWIPTEPAEDLRGFEWYLLRALGHSEVLRIADVGRMTFRWSPDQAEIHGLDHALSRFDARTGVRLAGTAGVRWIAATPDGSRAIHPVRQHVEVLLPGAGQQPLVDVGYEPAAFGISADGARGAFAGAIGDHSVPDRFVLDLFELPGMVLRDRLELPGRSADALAFSPDGACIALAMDRGGILLIGVEPLTIGLEIESPRTGPIAFDPGGRRLAVSCPDGAARIFDRATGSLLQTFRSPESRTMNLAWHMDGDRLATGSTDRTVRVWHTREGTFGHAVLGAHDQNVTGLCWSPDGTKLLTSDFDDLRVWDAAARVPLRLFPFDGGLSSLAFDRSGGRLMVASGRKLATWALDGEQRLHAEDGDHWCGNRDGTLEAVLAGRRCTVRRVADRSIVGEHEFPFELQPLAMWSPVSDQLLLSGSPPQSEAEIWSWTKHSAEPPRRLCSAGQLIDMMWCADGGRFVMTTLVGTLALVDATDGRTVRRSRTVDRPVSLARNVDGRQCAVANRLGSVQQFDAGFASLGAPVRVHAGDVWDLAWSPDGTRVATTGNDQQVRIWDSSTWEPMLTLRHPADVTRLAWSGDGRRLATGCSDGLVRVWDIAAARE